MRGEEEETLSDKMNEDVAVTNTICQNSMKTILRDENSCRKQIWLHVNGNKMQHRNELKDTSGALCIYQH